MRSCFDFTVVTISRIKVLLASNLKKDNLECDCRQLSYYFEQFVSSNIYAYFPKGDQKNGKKFNPLGWVKLAGGGGGGGGGLGQTPTHCTLHTVLVSSQETSWEFFKQHIGFSWDERPISGTLSQSSVFWGSRGGSPASFRCDGRGNY